MEKRTSIKKNALLNGLRTVLNVIFPLITFPYISRVLSVDEIGKYNFSVSIVTYFLLLAALGIDKYAVREGSKFRDDREQISRFSSEIFSINIISTIITYGILFLVLFFVPKFNSYYACIIILSLQIFFTTIGTEWLYTIFEDYQYITIRSIVFKVISILLMFIFVREQGDYLNYAWVSVFATVGSNVLNFFHAKKYCRIKFTIRFDWKRVLIPIMVIFASNVAIQIYVNSDITMLGFIKDDYTVGIYSISAKIYNIVKNVLTAILMVSIPRLSLFVGKKMQIDFDKLLLKVTNVLLIFVIPAMIGLIALSKDVILLIAGKEYLKAIPSLQILSCALIFSVFSTLFNQCVLLPYKREKKFLISSTFSAALNITLNFVFIPFLSEVGAAITTLIAELCMAALNYIFTKDITKRIFESPSTRKNLATTFVATGGVFLICTFITRLILNTFIQLLVSFLLSVLAYIFILLALKNPYITELLNSHISARKYKMKE